MSRRRPARAISRPAGTGDDARSAQCPRRLRRRARSRRRAPAPARRSPATAVRPRRCSSAARIARVTSSWWIGCTSAVAAAGQRHERQPSQQGGETLHVVLALRAVDHRRMQHDAGAARGEKRRLARQHAVAMRVGPAGELARAAEEDEACLRWRAVITAPAWRAWAQQTMRVASASAARRRAASVRSAMRGGDADAGRGPFRGIAHDRDERHPVGQQRPAQRNAAATRAPDDVDLGRHAVTLSTANEPQERAKMPRMCRRRTGAACAFGHAPRGQYSSPHHPSRPDEVISSTRSSTDFHGGDLPPLPDQISRIRLSALPAWRRRSSTWHSFTKLARVRPSAARSGSAIHADCADPGCASRRNPRRATGDHGCAG